MNWTWGRCHWRSPQAVTIDAPFSLCVANFSFKGVLFSFFSFFWCFRRREWKDCRFWDWKVLIYFSWKIPKHCPLQRHFLSVHLWKIPHNFIVPRFSILWHSEKNISYIFKLLCPWWIQCKIQVALILYDGHLGPGELGLSRGPNTLQALCKNIQNEKKWQRLLWGFTKTFRIEYD